MNLDLISIALSQYGLKEMPGVADNPVILQMAKDAGFKDYDHDSISWCSMFTNWTAFKAGYQRSNSLAARSWLTIGVSTDKPELGDIVVLWRDSPQSWKGHVGFFIREDTKYVYMLGGNQGDMVNIEDFDKNRVLDYRRLSKI